MFQQQLTGSKDRGFVDVYTPAKELEIEQKMDPILKLMKRQVIRKAKLYDGYDSAISVKKGINEFMLSAVEELGEVSSALTRERYQSALDECIDVMHSTLLLYIAIQKKMEAEDGEK